MSNVIDISDKINKKLEKEKRLKEKEEVEKLIKKLRIIEELIDMGIIYDIDMLFNIEGNENLLLLTTRKESTTYGHLINRITQNKIELANFEGIDK